MSAAAASKQLPGEESDPRNFANPSHIQGC
jgi:hypothetical protein